MYCTPGKSEDDVFAAQLRINLISAAFMNLRSWPVLLLPRNTLGSQSSSRHTDKSIICRAKHYCTKNVIHIIPLQRAGKSLYSFKKLMSINFELPGGTYSSAMYKQQNKET